MERLTIKQEEILKCTKKFIDKYGYSPTVRELCKLTKTSSSATIKYHLDILNEKGYITFKAKQSRTIRIVEVHDESSIT